MSKPQQKRFNASVMRYLLAGLLIIVLLGMGGLFYLAYGKLRTAASDVATIQGQADSADRKLQNLLKLNTELQQQKDAVDRAKDIVADSKHYQYQNQIISDLSSYARQTGVGITAFNFSESSSTSSADSSASSSAATPPPATPSPGATAAGGASPKSVQVSLQLSEKVAYKNFLNFLNRIEQNLSRMQISDVSLARNPESPKLIQPQTMTLEVYIR